jgi:TonB family protein
MSRPSCTAAALIVLAAGAAFAQSGSSLPRLVTASLEPAPWNVQSGGIAAYDVHLDETGAVTSTDLVQDVAPYGSMLASALPSWRFEPARSDGRAVKSRVLVLGLFRPPATAFAVPAVPRYKTAAAPLDIPWPTSVAVPPYPPNALGSGKVVMEADVSETGTVTAVRILTPASAFDGAASDAGREWKFRPARKGPRDVAARAFLVMSFVGPAR